MSQSAVALSKQPFKPMLDAISNLQQNS